jgi:predicted nucleotidyltransferase
MLEVCPRALAGTDVLHIPNLGIIIPIMGRMMASGLADALFSKTQQRVLGLLFGRPERRFYTTELIELAAVGSGAVQRELRRLTASGLVNVTRAGNQKYYQANRQAPIFEELRGMVAKTLGPAGILAEALEPAQDKLRLGILYGSVARGVDSARSDIDVLLVSDVMTLEEAYALLAPAEKQLNRPIGIRLLTTKEFQKRRDGRSPFLTNVLSGTYTVLAGADHDLAAR